MNKKTKIGLIIIAFITSLIITTKVYATTGKANQETVRMRKEATTDSSIVTLISINEEVEVLSEEGDWYKIKYKTYTGYVRKDMLDVEGKENNTTTDNENTSEQNNISEENKNEATAENSVNENNMSVENTNTSEEKQEIKIGYIGKISSKIELKIVPSITSSNINAIEENEQITVKDIINKWSYVETDNKSGWVLTSKIKIAEQKNEEVKAEENKEQEKVEEIKKTTEVTKYVSAETLNMREAADNNAKLINQLKVNTKVTVIETSGAWSKIKVNGKTGYVASKYLSDKKVEVTSRSKETSRNSENSIKDTSSSETESTSKTENTSKSNSGSLGSSIVECAKKYLGSKYVSGGSAPSTGFDCSGFTSYVYKQFGISISRSSAAQASNGTSVSKSNLQPGDLVIFNNRANTSIGHVGIYIGGNTFIHAANSGKGVVTTSLSDSYYSQRYVTGRRIIN